MTDPRFVKLAENLVNYCCAVQPGDRVLIEFNGYERELFAAIIDATYKAGGMPFISEHDTILKKHWLAGATDEALEMQAEWEVARMKEMDCFIGVRVTENAYDQADLAPEVMQRANTLLSSPVMEIRVPDTRWVVLRYPTAAMAQAAKMPTDKFTDFYFDVCNFDYSRMSKAMDALVQLLNRTDKIRIKGAGVDLSFSIKDIPAVPCDGRLNIPDGEVYTAPVKDSVNGYITYNTPSPYQGKIYNAVHLEFENGKIVKCSCDGDAMMQTALQSIFDTDEGARYVGEFAIGVNPYISEPLGDTLFDEKIKGSFHFTPGRCYKDAYNGNASAIHWDMVYIMRPEYGGGEIWADDVLISKDGLFVIDELLPLNPENLMNA
ncbi:MAG: aminopeptidase [Firmicutes bacterium]|nr:aminopeptidase [Bacillota bacterium]MBQ6842240.1 aminopeptidase [Bacillota bacterium]